MPPSEPGYLDVRPVARVLLPGQSVQLTATVFDDELTNPAAGLTFKSETPEIVSVDASGRVTAVAVGLGEVLVEDAGKRQRSVAIPVLDTMPAGPISIAFERPIVSLALGGQTTVPFEIFDGAASPIQANAIELAGAAVGATAGAVDIAVQGKTAVVSAKTAGLVEVRATIAEGTLYGRLLINVFDPAVVPHAVSCDDAPWVFNGCWMYRPALIYTVPGISDPARLELLEGRRCGKVDFTIRYRQVTPTRIDIGDSNVLKLNEAGQLTSVAPGATGFGASWDRYACDCDSARVYPDLNGCWNMQCANGDAGFMSFTQWSPRVIRKRPPRVGFGGNQAPNRLVARGLSALENAKEGFACEGPASFEPAVPIYGPMCHAAGPPAATFPTHFTASALRCGPGRCDGSGISFCGSGRALGVGTTPVALIQGPESFEVNNCKISRGSSCETTGFSCKPYLANEPNPPSAGPACSREFLTKACNRYGGACPSTFQQQGPRMEASLACICKRAGELRKCCSDARTAIGARTWSSTAPRVFSFIGNDQNPEQGVPVFCSVAGADCALRTDPEDKAACTKIVNDLDACNAQSCAISDWNGYAEQCENESGN